MHDTSPVTCTVDQLTVIKLASVYIMYVHMIKRLCLHTDTLYMANNVNNVIIYTAVSCGRGLSQLWEVVVGAPRRGCFLFMFGQNRALCLLSVTLELNTHL